LEGGDGKGTTSEITDSLTEECLRTRKTVTDRTEKKVAVFEMLKVIIMRAKGSQVMLHKWIKRTREAAVRFQVNVLKNDQDATPFLL